MRKVSTAVAFVGTVLLMSSAAFGQDAAAEKTLVANERAINEAVLKGNVAAFKEHVAAESYAIDSMMGRMSTAEFAKMLPEMSKDMKVDSWDIADPKVLWVDANTGVLMYKWVAKGTYQGQPMQSALASTVYNKRNGKWVAVFHQESAVPEPTKK